MVTVQRRRDHCKKGADINVQKGGVYCIKGVGVTVWKVRRSL